MNPRLVWFTLKKRIVNMIHTVRQVFMDGMTWYQICWENLAIKGQEVNDKRKLLINVESG